MQCYLSTSLPLLRPVPNGKLMVMACTAPVPPSYLHSAYCNNFEQLVCTWSGDTAARPPRPPPLATPQWSHPHHHSPIPMMSSILKQISAFRHICRLHFPLRFPLDEETPMEDVGQEDPLQYSAATISALDHLLSHIDSTTSTLSSNLTAESYAALAALPLSYLWSSLVLDLKDLLPILDRYVLTCLLASSAATGEDLQHDQALFPLLKTLAQKGLFEHPSGSTKGHL